MSSTYERKVGVLLFLLGSAFVILFIALFIRFSQVSLELIKLKGRSLEQICTDMGGHVYTDNPEYLDDTTVWSCAILFTRVNPG